MNHVYDFDSFDISNNEGTGYLEVTYTDPLLKGYKVIIAADSIVDPDEEDSRLTTMIAVFPRCVLAEFNTHRVFSRNSASSRARSMRVTLEAIMKTPYIPLFTKNQKGMSGDFMTVEEAQQASEIWLKARDHATAATLRLLLGDQLPAKYTTDEQIVADYAELVDFYQNEVYGEESSSALSVHKQNANRLLEPFMWHEVVVTSSYWSNYFDLRTDLRYAQPEIYAIAVLMQKAYELSQPVTRDQHTPFVNVDDYDTWDDLIDGMMVSSGEAAQVSYVDKSKRVGTSTVDFGRRLMSSGHLSPAEHAAIANKSKWSGEFMAVDGNYSEHWTQLRGLYETGQLD